MKPQAIMLAVPNRSNRLIVKKRSITFIATFLTLLLSILSQACRAAPEIRAVYIDKPPVIDGKLDDACWDLASLVSDFWVTRIDAPPAEPTTAYIAVDKDNIYVAFKCLDSVPSKICGFQKKRDGSFAGDDYVRVDLDTYHDHQTSTWFAMTAGGAQKDDMVGGTASKVEWKGDWLGACSIDDRGWYCEMSIPFSILRYKPGATSFGLAFARWHQRTTEIARWPRILNDSRIEDFADFIGLTVPEPRVSLRPVFMAYTIGEVGPRGALQARTGLDTKYQVGSNSTAVLTLNPDFESVEQQVESIDFSYAERRYDDYRPFFKEGEDNFRNYEAGLALFYSRRIPDFDVGAKYFGKFGRTNLSILNTHGEMDRSDLASHVRFDLGATSGAGAYYLARSDSSTDNRVSAFEGYSRNGNLTLGMLLGKSITDGEGGDGSFDIAYVDFDGRDFDFSLNYIRIGPEFLALDGYVPYNDLKGPTFYCRLHRHFRDIPLRSDGYSLQYTDFEDSHGRPVIRGLKAGVDFEWVSNIEASFEVERTDRGDTDEAGLYHVYSDLVHSLEVKFDCRAAYTGYGCEIAWGHRKGRRYSLIEPYWKLQPREQLKIQIGVSSVRHFEKDLQAVLTMTYDFSPERGIGMRIVTLNGRNNFYASYRHAVRKGMDLYLIFGDPNADSTVSKLTTKLVYPL